MTESSTTGADVQGTLQKIMEEVRVLQAESMVNSLLAKHALGILIRRSNEPVRVYRQLKARTLDAINGMSDTALHERDLDGLRANMLDLHEQVFAELSVGD